MTTDPKPLTRDELLAYAKLVVGDAYVADEALAALLRHCAALLPAEGAERMGVYRIPALRGWRGRRSTARRFAIRTTIRSTSTGARPS